MQVDDVTVGLMVQQFLDEWHFRVLHSGLAYAWAGRNPQQSPQLSSGNLT